MCWGKVAEASQPAEQKWQFEWPRLRTAEGIVKGTLLVPLASALFVSPEREAHWRSGIWSEHAPGEALPTWQHYRGTTLQQGRALLQQLVNWLPKFGASDSPASDSPAFYAVLAPRFASDYAGALLVGSY